MNTKKVIGFCLIAAVALGVAVWFALSPADVVETDDVSEARGSKLIEEVKPSAPRVESAAGVKTQAKSARKHKYQRAHPVDTEWTLDDFDDDEHPYSAKDKAVCLELQLSLDALDEFDEDEIKAAVNAKARGERVSSPALKARERFYAAAAKAAASSNPSVRKEAVAAYSWHGEEALPELTPLMADVNAEVAEEAIDAVETALDEQEDPNLRFETAAAYLSTFSVNEDALEMLSGEMSSAAFEIIDADDDTPAAEQRALNNRNLVVDTINSLIQNGQGKCVEAAKEAFSDITSEDWISYEEAQRWAMDPDNYEAPGDSY